MSLQLIGHSSDLQQLLNEGFELEFRAGYLLVREVPYVKSDKTIGRGILVTPLRVAGDSTEPPDSHVAYWIGEFPCDAAGNPMDKMGGRNQPYKIDADLEANHLFSRKPTSGSYRDYYHKMTTYVAFLEGEAQKLDNRVTARTFRPYQPAMGESVFCFADTASSRAGILPKTKKLEGQKIGIIGLGGTGSYVLDLVAKTPVCEIHLFDADVFLTHNAFRSPGTPSIEDLRSRHKKVVWFAEVYSKMRSGIKPHDINLDSTNLEKLEGLGFVFLCLDQTAQKQRIIGYLLEHKIPFIDVGMGLYETDESIGGIVRVTLGTPSKNDHLARRIGYADVAVNEYDRNIQIADLNALNGALAVIRWKKELGFYENAEMEYSSSYSVASNTIINDEVQSEEKENQT